MPRTYLAREGGKRLKLIVQWMFESDLKLPIHTDTEVMMDDNNVSCGWFMSRILKLKVDEVSTDEADANVCVDAKEKYTKAENNVEWEKEKQQIFSKP